MNTEPARFDLFLRRGPFWLAIPAVELAPALTSTLSVDERRRPHHRVGSA